MFSKFYSVVYQYLLFLISEPLFTSWLYPKSSISHLSTKSWAIQSVPIVWSKGNDKTGRSPQCKIVHCNFGCKGNLNLFRHHKTRHTPMNENMNLSGCLWRISMLAYKSCPHGGSFHYKLLEVLFSFWMMVHKVAAVIHVLKKKRSKWNYGLTFQQFQKILSLFMTMTILMVCWSIVLWDSSVTQLRTL